jgi:hypothetical protein
LIANFYKSFGYCIEYPYIVTQYFNCGARGGAVVKALRYKPTGRGFDSRWCHWNFSVTKSFRSHYGPGVESASNRNEYQVYFLGVKAAGPQGWQPYHHPVPLSWNLGTLTSWNPLGNSRPVTRLLYFTLTVPHATLILPKSTLDDNSVNFPLVILFDQAAIHFSLEHNSSFCTKMNALHVADYYNN